MARAFNVANSGRPGPVMVSLQENVISSICNIIPIPIIKFSEPSVFRQALLEIKEKLNNTDKPVVIVGGTGWSEEGKNNLPVISSFRRQDI